jgi:dTMP kinase
MTKENLLVIIAMIEKVFGKTISELRELLKCKNFTIALEGTDSSGKATQAALLCEWLNLLGFKAKVVSFPNYGQPSCSLVEKYLSGEFSENLSPKTISTFFAVDRSVKLQKEQEELKEYDFIIYDRYVMSNAIHQGLSFNGEEKVKFLKWVETLEYEMLETPRETLTIFIDMPLEFSLLLLQERVGKEGIQHDIHENREHLTRAYENAKFVSQYYGWDTVRCITDAMVLEKTSIKTREQISEEILLLVLEKLIGKVG